MLLLHISNNSKKSQNNKISAFQWERMISKRRPFKHICDRGTLISLHTKLPSLDRFSVIESYSQFGTPNPYVGRGGSSREQYVF